MFTRPGKPPFSYGFQGMMTWSQCLGYRGTTGIDLRLSHEASQLRFRQLALLGFLPCTLETPKKKWLEKSGWNPPGKKTVQINKITDLEKHQKRWESVCNHYTITVIPWVQNIRNQDLFIPVIMAKMDRASDL
jgi:hypothetical protein